VVAERDKPSATLTSGTQDVRHDAILHRSISKPSTVLLGDGTPWSSNGNVCQAIHPTYFCLTSDGGSVIHWPVMGRDADECPETTFPVNSKPHNTLHA
jgi:hypothetical protein